MFQIQPEYVKGGEYLALAEKIGANFEVLERSLGTPAPEQAFSWYEKSGRVTSLHGAFIDLNPVSNEPGIAAESKKRFEYSCACAKRIGAKNVVFHSSCFPNLRGKYLDGWAQNFAEYLVSLSEKFGLFIFVENSFDLDPGPLKELMRRAGGKIAACLDIGHAGISRAPIDEWFDALGENIKYLHLSDNSGLFDDHITLGKGKVDVKRASELCKYLGDIPMTLEVGGIDNIRASFDYMKENSLFGL